MTPDGVRSGTPSHEAESVPRFSTSPRSYNRRLLASVNNIGCPVLST